MAHHFCQENLSFLETRAGDHQFEVDILDDQLKGMFDAFDRVDGFLVDLLDGDEDGFELDDEFIEVLEGLRSLDSGEIFDEEIFDERLVQLEDLGAISLEEDENAFEFFGLLVPLLFEMA